MAVDELGLGIKKSGRFGGAATPGGSSSMTPRRGRGFGAMTPMPPGYHSAQGVRTMVPGTPVVGQGWGQG